MKFTKFFLVILIITSLLLTSVGCSDTADAYIYLELPELPTTLDPQLASSDAELIVVKNIHEGLLRYDDEGKLVPAIAEKFQKKGLEYTFNLRKDARWSNNEAITAKDFVFAFKRALSSENKAPFASRLFSIQGAVAFNSGTTTQLEGVKAIDSHTLKIVLEKEDPNFEHTLSTSVCMPCNEKFFKESKGKYGLFADNILSSGSYTLTRWRKGDVFGIRLYKSDTYKGMAKAKNAAVFITCDKEEAAIDKLEKESIDIAFIDPSLSSRAKSLGLETTEFNNVCWVMTLGREFTPAIRQSLAMLVGPKVYESSLPEGYSPADSIFPKSLIGQSITDGITPYDLNGGKSLFIKELNYLPDKSFPKDVTLYYYDNGNSKSAVTDIASHWQSNLSAFVNIKPATSADALLPELVEKNLKMAVFPVRAASSNISEYLAQFGIASSGKELSSIQSEILSGYSVIPLFYENTVLAYSPTLTNVEAQLGDGYVDLAYVVKIEK